VNSSAFSTSKAYVTIDPGEAPLKDRELLTEEKFRQMQQEYPGRFVAMSGCRSDQGTSEACGHRYAVQELRVKMKNENSQQKRIKFAKRLKVVEGVREVRKQTGMDDSRRHPPVIPPELSTTPFLWMADALPHPT
jgi:DNA-directed RNA polymerase subunit beta'